MRRVMLLALVVVLAGCAGSGAESAGTPTVIVERVTHDPSVGGTSSPTASITPTTTATGQGTTAAGTEPTSRTSASTSSPTPTETPTATSAANPTSTPTPGGTNRLVVAGRVVENATHWHVIWKVTNVADQTIFYEFDPIHKLIDEDGQVRTARLRVANRAFEPGETVVYEWKYNKENWEDRGWDDRGPYALDIDVYGYEVRG